VDTLYFLFITALILFNIHVCISHCIFFGVNVISTLLSPLGISATISVELVAGITEVLGENLSQ
jgi:hypothetical protein